jgi:hypothetical protein
MEGSVAQPAVSMLARASDDIDLHFIQKPPSSGSFKECFRFRLQNAHVFAAWSLLICNSF